MVNVIRHGSPYRFECLMCGCVWTATKDDMKSQAENHEEVTGEKLGENIMICPECNTKTKGKACKLK